MRNLIEYLMQFILGVIDWAFTPEVLIISAILSIVGGIFAVMIGLRVSKSKQMNPQWREAISLSLYALGGLSVLVNITKLIVGALWRW